MRDNREGLPEILDAVERDRHYFGVAQVVFGEQAHAFEFGVDVEGFKALRKVLQLRPFAKGAVGPYRYFFVPSVRRLGPESDQAEFAIRVEQAQEGRQFSEIGPRSLVANLMWFFELKSADAASHLRRAPSRPEV
jgi:hypothetical protein